jgi:2-polyprenyl-6-methoxyphenol hydroxylase-like FAD-dependent oxidoreductase
MKTPVLIVGAGPTGLTLAIDLALRGIACTLIEKKPAPEFLPKMERCNARSMEIYRRMGLADQLRREGLPAHCPMDVFIVLSLVEKPLLQLPYPSVADAKREIAACEDMSMPLEPYQLISQYTLEPALKRVADSMPNVTVLYGHELVDFTQDAESVHATVKNAAGETQTIDASYMAGCDGGGSLVRRKLDIELKGDSNLLRFQQALYRCDGLYDRIPIGKGRHYHVADDKATFFIVQDSTNHFTLHATVENPADMGPLFERTVAMPVKYEILYVGGWRQNLLLADSYGAGRVFLAGDAAHLVIPTGGLGMNTGVGDAIDLSWKLAATLKGWGGPNTLGSYELERRQIGERNVAASTFASRGRRKWRSQYKPEIADKTPEGAAARANLIAVADVEQRKSNEMIGAELGYRYGHSPLIADEGDGAPEPDFMVYRPSTWPGSRLPHVWLEDGTAMQDRIGFDHGFTLLNLSGRAVSGVSLNAAFTKHQAPFRVLNVPGKRARALYGYDFILLRPDMHIVWRGQTEPANAAQLAAMATGH